LGYSTRSENCGEEYFTREGQYAISALIIVDDKKLNLATAQVLVGPGAYMTTVFIQIPELSSIHKATSP
jgi:hypothetical protein